MLQKLLKIKSGTVEFKKLFNKIQSCNKESMEDVKLMLLALSKAQEFGLVKVENKQMNYLEALAYKFAKDE